MPRGHEPGGHVSASQIATFLDCPRKWAYQYVDGLRGAPNKYAELGGKIHEIRERWFRDGIPPDLNTREGQIALAGLGELPAPSKHLRVEHKFNFVFDKIEYLGFIDLHWLARRPSLTLEIVDHKSTTNFRWMKTAEELAFDPQRILYSTWGVFEYREIEIVNCTWHYTRTTPPPSADQVRYSATRDEVLDSFAGLHDVAQNITAARKMRSHELVQNFDMCEAYGGCPFQERCHGGLTPIQRMKSIFAQEERELKAKRGEGTTMGLSMVERIKLKQQQNGSAAPNLAEMINGPAIAAVEDEPAAAPPSDAPPQLSETFDPVSDMMLESIETPAEKPRRGRTPRATASAAATAAAMPLVIAVDVTRLMFHLCAFFSENSAEEAEARYEKFIARTANTVGK